MPKPIQVTDLSIAEAARQFRTGSLSPVDVAEATLARIEAVNPKLSAYITVTSDVALNAAKASEARFKAGKPLGPFDGIPFALKDNVETAGIRSTSHSKLLFDNVPKEDAHVAAKLTSAGGVLLGKTATFEFALGGPAWDLPFPPALNPWDLKHLPGGSSSGSGAAVAARLAMAAIGTDTGGSVRWPAAVCGIAGLKPTYGRISRRGVHPNTFSLDHCGPMTRTVEDCAIMLGACAGFDPKDPGSIDEPVPDYAAGLTGSVKGLKIGLVTNWFETDAAPEVSEAVAGAMRILEGLGANVTQLSLAPLQDYVDCKTTISLSELYAIHEPDLKTRPQDFGKLLRTRVIAGGLIRAEDYVQAMRWRNELTTQMLAEFGRFDLLATAGWLTPAESADPQGPDFFKRRMIVTMPFSLSGIPALSVPCGFSQGGLPLAFQLAGKPFDEMTVLRAGDAYQRVTEWHLRQPQL
ncbi:MAG: Asp-tRNA(Asn)/Glu-tRNA(Gln) amidotransferase subunit GatA [Proteobacteria bacterium]|nr:Asp-tRNA(Asn)/Glu-tRNA(Gln) amidotransferase subunit GatA [Pseudomonadota bacterium]